MGLDSDLWYESVYFQERIWFTSHEYLACLINMHQDIMQECSPHGIHVHELSDTSHTFLWDLPCQRGCPTTLLHLHLLRWVRLKHYCSKRVTHIHEGRNYKREGINLWDLQRPLSSNKKYCSFASFFSFFFHVSVSQGVSHTTELLKISWVITFLRSFPGFDNTRHACESQLIYERIGSTQTLHLPS